MIYCAVSTFSMLLAPAYLMQNGLCMQLCFDGTAISNLAVMWTASFVAELTNFVSLKILLSGWPWILAWNQIVVMNFLDYGYVQKISWTSTMGDNNAGWQAFVLRVLGFLSDVCYTHLGPIGANYGSLKTSN